MRYLRSIFSFLFISGLFSIFAYFISNNVVMKGVDALEVTQIVSNLDRMLERLELMESKFAWQMRALAGAEFTYEALKREDISGLKQKFSSDYLSTLRLSGLAFFSPHAKPLLVLNDDVLGSEQASHLEAYVKVCQLLLDQKLDQATDLLTIQGETYVISAQRVWGQKEPYTFVGIMVALKALNREFSSGAETNAISRFSILPVQSYFVAEATENSVLFHSDEYKIVLNHQEIFAYALTNDIFGKPACCIEARSERFLVPFGQQISKRNLIFMISVGLFFLAFTMYLMHKIEREAMQRELENRSNYDALTTLLNKSSLTNRLRSLIKLKYKNKEPFSLIFVNLERFRAINDSYGYEMGDQLLFEVARRFTKNFPRENLARFSGDKFCVIVECEEDKLIPIANSIQQMFYPGFKINAKEIYLSCNMGIATFPKDSRHAKQLIHRAELAMYQAENSGDESIKFYAPEMDIVATKRLKLETALIRALDDKTLLVYYQPKVDVNLRDVLSCEALVRWKRDNTWISPGEFIPLAEETGQVTRLDMFVLRQACRQVKQWIAEGLGKVRVAVNMSAKSIVADNFVEHVDQILSEEDVSVDLVEVEITETTLLSDLHKASEAISNLSKKGIRVSLDDFGTGYSSLRYLNSLPITCMKIDKSFVDGLIDPTPSSCELVRGTLALAQGMGKDTVAEGVEKKQQLDFLHKWGCNVIQGYIFSRPLPGKDFSDFLLHKSEYIAAVLDA